MTSRLRKIVARGVMLLIGLAVSLGLLEGLLTAFSWVRYGTIDVHQLQANEVGNIDLTVSDSPEGYAATLAPHPYLGFVKNERVEGKNPEQTTWRLNNVGLVGRDFPLKKDKSKFTILLTGGSVANHFGIAGDDGRSYLESILNDEYRFDREVVVLNGACGAWKQPQQAIMSLLYAEVADAIITLDGANEGTRRLTWPLRLEYPANNFHIVNPVAEHGYENLAISWQMNQLDQFSQRVGLRTVYFAARLARNRLANSVSSDSSGMSLETIMALPEGWTDDERFAFNIEQYKKYIRSIDSIAELHGAKRAFFVQPCPAIGKTLTAAEREKAGDLGYGVDYQKMTDELLTLNKEGVPVVSLLDVFAETKETIYGDKIHPRFDGVPKFTHTVNFGPSTGHHILAKAIAKHLAEAWNVPKKSEGK